MFTSFREFTSPQNTANPFFSISTDVCSHRHVMSFCICLPNFVAIGLSAELWRHMDF